MSTGKLRNGGDSSKSHGSVWCRAASANSQWPDKDEFLDVIYWARQALGIVLGVIWGVLPFRGFVGILLFALGNAGIVYIYFSNYQKISEEEFGGAWELTKEGFMTSFAGFLVTWIIVYSGLYCE